MSKNKSFIKGTLILSLAGIIVKILGALYRIPLANIIKDEGMGYYQTAYPFYVLLLTISTSGFPIAIAKLVAEKNALGDYRASQKVFKLALIGLSLGGLLSALFIFINGEKIVRRIDNINAYYALMALIPALFFVPIMSAFRGYFQGRQNMAPTALSQIVEQLTRLVSGLFFTYAFLDQGLPKAAGGASLGGSLGAVLGCLTMLLIYLIKRKDFKKELVHSRFKLSYSNRELIGDLLKIALPITIGASIIPIMDTIDASLVIKRLQTIDYSREMANEMYGQLKGFAQTLVNVPQVISLALAMSLVPAIAEASSRKDRKKVEDLVTTGLKISFIIGFPAALGLLLLSRPIIDLLYFRNSLATIISTSRILAYLAPSIIFLSLVQSSTAILQGLGKPFKPVVNLLVGALVKLLLTYVLTAQARINIVGAALSTVVAYGITASLNLRALNKEIRRKINYRKLIYDPLLSSIIMGVLTTLSHRSLSLILSSRLATILSIGLGGLSYVILLIIRGTIRIEDVVSLPNRRKFGAK